jgi:hypothetical protein
MDPANRHQLRVLVCTAGVGDCQLLDYGAGHEKYTRMDQQKNDGKARSVEYKV